MIEVGETIAEVAAVFTAPEVVGADLVEVIDGLLALPERPT